MLELLIGRDWTVNTDTVMTRLAEDVAAEKGNRILLVPELISHDTERRLCEKAGDPVSRFAAVTGFSRLPGLIARYCKEAVPPCMDQAGCVAAMASAARQLHGSLKAYAAVESRPEFLTQMVDAVDEFKRCCISAEDLNKAAQQSTGELAQKLQELSLLLQAYDAICMQGKRDPRDLLNWALEAMEDSDFAENHVFYIDGFPDFTRQHLAVIAHFIRHSTHVTVSLNCDRIDSDKYAFEKAGHTARQLMDIAKAEGVDCCVTYLDGRDDHLAPLRDGLFQGKITPVSALSETVRLYELDSIHRECQAAAEDVQQLVRAGSRYRDIAVVCADMEKYRPILGMAFRRAGIPFYLSGTELVSDSFVMNTVFAAMEAAQSGFEQSAMRRYLRSVLSPLDPDTCDLVENYVFTWAIQGSEWKKTWTKHPGGLENTWHSADHAMLARLEEARQTVIEPLLRLQSGFSQAQKVSDQVHALYRFFEDIRLASRMEQLASELDDQGDNRTAQVVNQLWEILLTALEQLEDTLGQTAWDSDVFGRLLTLLLSQYDVGTIPTVLDSVTVGPVSAMRCQRPVHLLVLGCAEGKLPGYTGGNSVLSDGERDELRKLDVPLTGGSLDGIQVEFSEVYGVFCGASGTVRLYCSDPQPSFVYRRIRDMVGQTALPVRDENLFGDRFDAAAYLLRAGNEELAQKLGLSDAYAAVSSQKAYDMGHITPENVGKLYGSQLHLSASKVDTFAKCRLAYFLKYGLKLKERVEATIDSMQYGTFVHAVLENTVRDVMASGGFRDISLEEVSRIAKAHIDRYVEDNFAQIDSSRLQYLLQRNMQELDWIVRELWDELRQAQYRPVAVEYAFGDGGDMPSIQIPNDAMEACLDGKVDRIDVFDHPNGTFYRVVDYKTGDKSIDYCDILCGVGLQMLLYLFVLQEQGTELLGEAPTPAGVQYFRAKVPHLAVEGAEDTGASSRENGWKHSGLILNDDLSVTAMDPDPSMPRLACKRNKDGTLTGYVADGQQFQQLRQYIFNLLGEFVTQIADGNVTANPYIRGTFDSACTYCAYNSVCNRGRVPGMRNFRAVKENEFWETVRKECEDHG